MNIVVISGRITADPELKTFNSGNDYVNFTVAVDRDYKDKDGNRPTDFISCQATGPSAKFISNYFKKGDGIDLEGSWRVDVSEKDGKKTYFNKCIVNKAHFPISKPGSGSSTPAQTYEELPNDDGDLPF